MPTSRQVDAIRRVVAAFEGSDWSEIDVRWGDVRVHLAARPPSDALAAVPNTEPAAVAVDDAGVGVAASGEHVESGPGATPHLDTGTHVVVAPSPGVFWRSPQPGAPPFAEVGAAVEASSTLCIIEVMKLMNHLKAGVDGVVVAVFGENGVAVQKGEPLFAIAPVGSGT